jgi:lambda repressor-like predicted transcriptional regulator
MTNQSNLIKMHPADIEAALKKRGKSFADVGRSKNLPRQVVSAVLHHQAAVFEGIEELLKLPELGTSA